MNISFNITGIIVYNIIWQMAHSTEANEPREYHSSALISEVNANKVEDILRELKETKQKLGDLEAKFHAFNTKNGKSYPDVKYQNFRSKKRILVPFL